MSIVNRFEGLQLTILSEVHVMTTNFSTVSICGG